jgi:hypothetical protein
MSKRRRLLLFGLLAGLLVLGVGGWLLWPWPRSSAITAENAAKIQKGMTLAEVEAILGGPARNETTGPTFYELVRSFDKGILGFDADLIKEWISDEVGVILVFDAEGCALGVPHLRE